MKVLKCPTHGVIAVLEGSGNGLVLNRRKILTPPGSWGKPIVCQLISGKQIGGRNCPIEEGK